jgi:ligand-binding sensor domain-containing protein
MSRFRYVPAALLAAALGLSLPADAPADTRAAAPPDTAATGLDPALLVTQYAADAWGLDDGLPQSVVETVARTSDGHIWLGTQEGLARFDGARFVVVDAGRGLPDPRVLALAGDPRPGAEGSLWVGTRDGGLVYLDRDLRPTVYDEASGLPGGTVAALVVERSGRVWAGTREGLCMVDPPALPAGGGAGVRAGRARVRCTAAGLEDPYIRRMAPGRGGVLWIGTRAGLHRMAGGRIASLAARGGIFSEPITALGEDRAGGLWIGSMAGPGFAREGRQVERPELAGLAGIEVSAVLEDRAGSVWLGTYGEGLVRIRRGGRPETLKTADGADLSGIRALHQDPEGSLWVGAMGGGLARLRDAKFTPFGAPEGLGADRAFTVAADRDGAVWVGTAGAGSRASSAAGSRGA